MKTFSQHKTEQPTGDTNRQTVNSSETRPNWHNDEVRGTLDPLIQALFMPSVEEFVNEYQY
ncbi:hypothetical protein [Spirosoma sordidisoli]|uniref:Uncharacterized protein n=1 Tax=Spirosoma sordidisoli TaxID=2502893 RepID=A0A4Q2UE13_9BACT|nr:hypothetical protein [Spirosoma sordidisoli]RYC66492.1 hypothetical protein EQG79_29410 [Spirosoma sordidisoli]